MKKLTKLNMRGATHIIVPLIVIVLVGIIGTYLLVKGHANSLNCQPVSINKVSALRCGQPCPTGTSGSKHSDGYYYCFGQATTTLNNCTQTTISGTPVLRCNYGCPAGTKGSLSKDSYFYCFGTPVVSASSCQHVIIGSTSALRCNYACPAGYSGSKHSDGYYYCFGGSASATSSSVGGYYKPIRSTYTAGRIDQGVDYALNGNVYAIGDGVVLHTYDGGWPGGVYIVYRLTNGTAAGKYVYVAEDCTPKVSINQSVNSNTVLCTAFSGRYNIETGWSMLPPGPIGEAAAYGWYHSGVACDGNGAVTNYGMNFNALMVKLGLQSTPRQAGCAVEAGGASVSGYPNW